MRSSKIITVSLPAELARLAERLAKEERRTRSELVREALRDYAATRRWRRLRRWGEASAQQAGVRTDRDIENAVGESRRSRR